MSEHRDSIRDIWGQRTPYMGEWPERVDTRVAEEPERWVQSACVLCSTGCALDIGVRENRIVGVRGRSMDRVNRGRLGPKGLHGWEANHDAGRLTTPMIRRDGRLVPSTWNEAMDLIVRRTREIEEKHSPQAIGFYSTGQLFLEEYYTLSLIARAGIGTRHIDANVRLCTATAAAALRESFGSDGQPGSYSDFDVTDALFCIGSNIAYTQTVLWSRVLDRRRGPSPPKLVVVDPRLTETAKEADLHLAPRPGTNLALMNGLLHLVIAAGHVDRGFIERRTTGFEALQSTVSRYTPARVEHITGVPAALLREAAEILGTSPRLVSVVLQGVYQSNQATASAVQVNNLHLIRGLIGKPGCAPFQMNGQPTAQNTRECGATSEKLAAFRNWANSDHVREMAHVWNIEPSILPDRAPETHALEMFQRCEEGSIRMLWVLGTNPATSLPDLDRIRAILRKEDLFLVVNDAFPNETTRLADVVLPAAMWAEKTGCFTNSDRTVHISHQAIQPPGDARPDLDILLDFARRMDFRDRDGQPLVKWHDPESAFEAFKQATKGWPCDYSGLTYAKLSQGSGIPWPCNDEHPAGRERLYTDHVFHTGADDCETYGHDLATGNPVEPRDYRANDPGGRAIIKAAEYAPPTEEPDGQYPFWLTTGRDAYHFHTRTKTGRARELQAAAPDAYVQLSGVDAARHGIFGGDMVEVESRRGAMRAPARIGDIAQGLVFVPFHYGDWDEPERPRAANSLTLTAWDPVSKQPHFKYAAVRIRKL
jgi:ferredoxin-nitrate reductase